MSLPFFAHPFIELDFVSQKFIDTSKRIVNTGRKFLAARDWQRQLSSFNNLQHDLSSFNLVKGDYCTYSITIYVDLPIDDDPSVLFDPQSFYAGHCFIELSKSNPYRMARKVIGWYPDHGVVAISGTQTKGLVVDDGGHEFQASYRISVDSSQFEAVIETLQSVQNRKYHISTFNCVDFVLELFNAAGGDIQLPVRYHIPIIGSRGGDHTPNGLFEKIETLRRAGVIGAMANFKKNYCLPVIGSKGESV